jgi:hypothetical protein
LKIAGEVDDEPFARTRTFRKVAATLTCVDLSI